MDENIQDNLTTAAIVGVGAVAGTVAVGKLPEKVQKFAGPALIAAGIAAQFVDNSYAQDFGVGLIASGALKTVKEYVPDAIKAKLNLEGLGAASDEGETVEFLLSESEELQIERTPEIEELLAIEEAGTISGYDDDDELDVSQIGLSGDDAFDSIDEVI